MTLPGRSKDYFTPRDYAEMLCFQYRNSEKELPFSPISENHPENSETEPVSPSIFPLKPEYTTEKVIKHFGFKRGSIGPTIGRLAKRVNLREKNRRLFIIG